MAVGLLAVRLLAVRLLTVRLLTVGLLTVRLRGWGWGRRLWRETHEDSLPD